MRPNLKISIMYNHWHQENMRGHKTSKIAQACEEGHSVTDHIFPCHIFQMVEVDDTIL